MRNRLRVLRAERAWPRAALADRVEMSPQTVNALETGRYDPGPTRPPAVLTEGTEPEYHR